jgi:hypothetical protein
MCVMLRRLVLANALVLSGLASSRMVSNSETGQKRGSRKSGAPT